MKEKEMGIANDLPETVPYLVHESDAARLERANKRLFILCILLVIIAVGSNIYWLYYESQFEDVTTTVTQDIDTGDSGTATINDGVHINGENQANSNS